MAASNSDAEHSWLLPPEVLENSPSKADGLDEKTYRRRTAIFIETAGLQLKFPRLTVATAQVFFQRFYALHSFKTYKRFEIAVTCLFLSGKVEDQIETCRTRNLETVICVCHQQWHSQPSSAPSLKRGSPDAYEAMRQTVLKCERVLLHTIAFDLCVQHPYKNLMDTVGMLVRSNLFFSIEVAKQIKRFSYELVNHSMRTSLCLQHEPQSIADAAIYFATVHLENSLDHLGQRALPEVLEVRGRLGIDSEELRSICAQLMELYTVMPSVDPAIRKTYGKLVSSGVIPPGPEGETKGGVSSGTNAGSAASPPPPLPHEPGSSDRQRSDVGSKRGTAGVIQGQGDTGETGSGHVHGHAPISKRRKAETGPA